MAEQPSTVIFTDSRPRSTSNNNNSTERPPFFPASPSRRPIHVQNPSAPPSKRIPVTIFLPENDLVRTSILITRSTTFDRFKVEIQNLALPIWMCKWTYVLEEMYDNQKKAVEVTERRWEEVRETLLSMEEGRCRLRVFVEREKRPRKCCLQ